MNMFKLAVYAAAGVGTYELLRRYGLLQKAGAWLQEQVPDEYMERAQQYGGQLRDRATQYTGQLRDQAQHLGEQAQQMASSARDAVGRYTGQGAAAAAGGGSGSGGGGGGGASSNGGGNGLSSTGLTGPARGTEVSTDEMDGGHLTHKVGRGVVH